MFNWATFIRGFRQDQGGNVAIIFALMTIPMLVTAGLAIDSGRAYRVKTKVAASIDAAALTAAKNMREANLNDNEVKTLALRLFNENMKGNGQGDVTISSFGVAVDRTKNSVQIDVTGEVPTTLGRLTGINKFDVPATTVAIYDSKDIELSLALDMTGSMWGQKIADLKAATRDLINIMLPDGGTANKVRIAFAPFAAGVNAGSYAVAASNNRSPDNCVYERQGADKLTDAAPAAGSFMKVAGDSGVTTRQYKCPGPARVLALSDDKTSLLDNVANFEAKGSTAGHLGTAWAWYLVSPEWKNVWPGASEPAAYDDGKTIKAVILMTDGVYNTYGGKYSGSSRAKSQADAAALCANIKAKKVVVYSIGFQLNNAGAVSLLKGCASSPLHFFQAQNGDQLRAAFRAIAVELNSLRLSK